MASTNFKLFDENKTNMMSDTEYNINTQRLNGVQAGIASSQLQNKTLYQTSLVAYSLAQIMMQNGYDANDSAVVSSFVGNLSNSLLQKVLDKATSVEAQNGVNNTKWMSPALTKAAIDILAAKAQNILSDETKTLFGLGASAVPDDALQVIKTLIDNANTNANTKAKIETGSYTGNGNTKIENPNSLTFGFVPKVVFICRDSVSNFNVGLFFPIALAASYKQYGYAYINQGSGLYVSDRSFARCNGNTLSWYYNATSAGDQLNISGITYHYIAIG